MPLRVRRAEAFRYHCEVKVPGYGGTGQGEGNGELKMWFKAVAFIKV
jgi:hypothetical protein